MSDDFLKTLMFRFAVAALMPNFLVVCFWASDMADNRYPMWRLVVGPYWHGELILFFSLSASLILWSVIQVLPSIFKALSEIWEEISNSTDDQRWNETQDRLVKAAEQQILEEELLFNALSVEERNRIKQQRSRYLERRCEEKRLAAEKEQQRKLAEAEARKAEEERRRIEESKPENVRKNAVSSFVGSRR